MLVASVTITGAEETIDKLGKLGESLVMNKLAMESIGKELTDFYGNAVFDSQGGIIGERWAALSPKYQASKIKKYQAAAYILEASGTMKSSFDYEADDQGVTIYNSTDYFAYHQSDEPRTIIPQRKVFKINDQVLGIVNDIINQSVQNKIQDLGF